MSLGVMALAAGCGDDNTTPTDTGSQVTIYGSYEVQSVSPLAGGETAGGGGGGVGTLASIGSTAKILHFNTDHSFYVLEATAHGFRSMQRGAFIATAVYGLFLWCLSMVFLWIPIQIISIFDQSSIVVSAGAVMVRVLAATLLCIAPGVVLSRSLVGAGDTLSPLIITLLSLWGAQIPLAYVLSNFTSLGVNGIFLAIALANLTHGTMMIVKFSRGGWVRKRVL